MHFLLHPLYRCISNQIIFFSGPKQRTFLFLLSSLVHTTFLPFILPQFVLLSGYFTFFIIRLHKRIFLKPSLSPPLLSPSFHPPPSQFFFSLISPQPSLPIACDEERYTLSSSLHKWREEGVRTEGGREEEEERWWWWRAAGKDPFSKRYLFICFPSTFHWYLGGRKKRGDSEKKEKKKQHTHAHSHIHTENGPRWPSLIKEIFHERLTSLSTMLRQDNPLPNKPQLPKGDLYLCLGGKAQHSRPSVTLSEHQTVSPVVSERLLLSETQPFPERISPPLVLAGNSDRDIRLGCSSFLKSIQEACIHPPEAAFNPLIMRRTAKPSHSCLHSHKHA